MNSAEWAKEQIERDLQNIEDLKAERKEAWSKGDRKTYDSLTHDIRDLNQGIKALKESYGIE